jgi:hypothetical protein
MALSDLNLWGRDVNSYMTDYFGTEDWRSSATTQSGIDSMVVDLEMMSRGISLNLNYFTEMDRTLSASGIELTNTVELQALVTGWAYRENTNYAAVLLAEFTRLLVKREPVLQLRHWFELDMEQCEVLWKTIVLYDKINNLPDAYGQAVAARRQELIELSDINLEGDII